MVAGALVLVLAGPVVAPAVAAGIDAAERQSMTLDEARDYTDSLGFEAPEVDLVESTELTSDDARAAGPAERDSMPSAEPTTVVVPDGGAVTLDLPATEPGADVSSKARRQADGVHGLAGGLGVELRPAGLRPAAGPVEVEHLTRSAAESLGIAGPVVALRAVDAVGAATVEPTSGGQVRVGLDVSYLAGAGADLVHRLRLVRLPECAVTSPEIAGCREATPVSGARLDPRTLELIGEVEVPARSARAADDLLVLAVTAGTAGSAGDWGATSLSPSASWNVSTQSGAFSWPYPMRTPPVPGGLAPELSLSYSSASLDGRVVSANSQASQVGDGWEANLSGYVERKYVPCSEDQAAVKEQAPNNATRDTGDLCWKSNNATLVFNGSSTELVREGSTNTWRPENDDNTKVVRATGGSGGGQDGEHWVVTTDDGTKYTFGGGLTSTGVASLSVQYVRVYGNHPGEPCHATAFADSSCAQMPYRWNLDQVEDTSGNTISYTYERETNRYGHNLNSHGSTTEYVSGARLAAATYGTRAGATTAAPAEISFGYAERCVPTADFDCAASKLNAANSSHWPDVPQDLICTSGTTCPQTSPAFYDRKRLTDVTTNIRDGGTLVPVDRWSLTQTYPDVGDGQSPALWLESIRHTGLGGAAADVALPDVRFHGAQKDNRVDTTGDLGPAMTRYRLDEIRTEAGGLTTIAYSGRECSTSNLPDSPQSNSMRCQPVWWTPEGAAEQVMEYFHHYRVESVTQDGRVAGTVPVDTTYEYTGGPEWHYADSELIKPKYRTWGELRGYSRVDVYTGAPGEEDAPQLHTAYRYFRGMHGDRNGAGGTTTDQVDGIDDLDQYAGMVREEITYDGSDVVERTLSTPWRSAATATDPDDTSKKAFHTEIARAETVTPLAAGGERTTLTETTFDSYGMPETVSEHGSTGATGDELCTRTTYARNTTANILNTAQRVETVGVRCDQTATRPQDVVSDVRYAYDTGAVGATPSRGLVTLTQEADRYASGAPVYVDTSKAQYNSYGQPTSATDALGNVTATDYDNTGGLTRSTTSTSPDPDGTGPLTSHVTTTVVDPLWGAPTRATDPNGKVTQGRYDALGRLTAVWEPGRVPDQHDPTSKFTYQVTDTGLNTVLTETLNWDASGYVASSDVYDGLLRERQTQAPSASATVLGRVVNDTLYDSRGLTTVTRDGWSTTGAASASLVVSAKAVDARTVTAFDGAGRPVSETFQSGEGDQSDGETAYLDVWTTTTSYGGDRVTVDPPQGGIPTTTVMDSRGRTSELWQYEGASPSGTHHVTTYEYDDADRLIGMADPAGNEWSYGYDLRGRQTSASDPDKGDGSMTYDAAGRVLTTTDARGEVLGYTYDNLGRKTSLRAGGTSGTVRASWSYDKLTSGTVVKGQQTAATRHHDGVQLTTTVDGFTDRYQPTATTVSIPQSASTPAGLAGQYTYRYTYTKDGRVRTQSVPGAGPITAEGLTTQYSATNAADGLTGGFGWGNYVVRADYLPTGEVSYLRTGNTKTYQETSAYDRGTRRLESVTTMQQVGTAEDPLNELRHAAYTYDDAGNVLSVADTPDPALGGQLSDQQCFTYDWARRLTGAWTPASGDCATAPSVAGLGGADPYWKSYAYDAVGNRTSSTLHQSTADGGNVTSGYTRPDAGAARPHAVSSVTAKGAAGAVLGTSTFSYDDAGNLTGRAVAGQEAQELSWDTEGELESVAEDTDGDGSVSEAEQAAADEYVYTADGDRLIREQDGDTTLYLPGQEITLDGQTGQVRANRYYSFAGRTVAVRDGSAFADVSSVFSDHHNTATLQIANTTNQVTRRYTDPFGASRDSAAGLPDPTAGGSADWVGDHGFLDKPSDTTGLTAVGARLYDPVLGSFISVDPVMDLSDPQQWNAYAYANNNPLTWSDPTGLLLGPLIDGAYTAPTRGKPGSGGWQVAPNRTGYTGRWNNGGSYRGPNSIGDRPVYNGKGGYAPGAKARIAAAAAAHRRLEQRRLQQRKAQERAAAQAREAQTQKREQKNSWLKGVGNWAMDAADKAWDASGEAAEYMTESKVGKSIEFACGFAFGAAGTLCGAVYTAAYARQGKWDKMAVSAAGMIGGGAAGKVVAKSVVKRFASDLPANPALSVARSIDPVGDALGVTDVRRLYGTSYVTSNLAGIATSGVISSGGNSLIGEK